MLLQGRIHQLEYAEEAVKQGSATVGLKNKTHAILVALKVIEIVFYHYLFDFLKEWSNEIYEDF